MRILVYLSSKLLINREMLKVVTFMKQVARGLQIGGETLVLHMYTVAVSMPSLLIVGKRISPLMR